MNKKEIISGIESFNNAVFIKLVTNKNEKGYLKGMEFHFKGTNFAVEGVSKLFDKVIHVGNEGYFITFEYNKATRKLV
jgi:hypothetical protein